MRKTHFAVYLLFLITATIVLLNRYTNFYINDYRVHFLFDFLAASSFVIIIGHLFKKLRTNGSILVTFLIVGVACFLKAFFTWGGDWKTQTILYQNTADSDKTIDIQLRADPLSLGYKERVICKDKLGPFMEWTTDIDTLHLDETQWKRIHKEVNEMGLKKNNF